MHRLNDKAPVEHYCAHYCGVADGFITDDCPECGQPAARVVREYDPDAREAMQTLVFGHMRNICIVQKDVRDCRREGGVFDLEKTLELMTNMGVLSMEKEDALLSILHKDQPCYKMHSTGYGVVCKDYNEEKSR